MEQVGQRKIDGLWLMVVGIAVLFFLILPTLIVIPMSFSGASFLEFPPTSFSLRWYDGLLHLSRMDERHEDFPNCGGVDHSDRDTFRFPLCLWPVLFYTTD